MSNTNILEESTQVRLAIELIELGARLQVLQAETEISRRRLINLYKEIHDTSPPKGMLPFSTDWYVSWLPNIHASLFYNTYCQFTDRPQHTRIGSVAKAYRIYLEQTALWEDGAPVLSLTRAWMLVRYFESDMMQISECKRCYGRFVNHAYALDKDYICGICRPPSRAGKRRSKTGQR